MKSLKTDQRPFIYYYLLYIFIYYIFFLLNVFLERCLFGIKARPRHSGIRNHSLSQRHTGQAIHAASPDPVRRHLGPRQARRRPRLQASPPGEGEVRGRAEADGGGDQEARGGGDAAEERGGEGERLLHGGADGGGEGAQGGEPVRVRA